MAALSMALAVVCQALRVTPIAHMNYEDCASIVAMFDFAEGCVRLCISGPAPVVFRPLAKSCQFAMLIGFLHRFTCFCNDTASLDQAMSVGEQAEITATMTTAELLPVSCASLPGGFL
jgi:hypothetical protein